MRIRRYVLPLPEYDADDRSDWDAIGPETAELVSRLGLDDGFVGQHLTDTLFLIRERASDASSERVAEAFDYYLTYDTWPDWLA